MTLKCDTCGEKATTQTGLFIYCYGERYGRMCKKDHTLNPGANPIFKNERAWLYWKKKHPRLANRVIAKGGPKFQFFLKEQS